MTALFLAVEEAVLYLRRLLVCRFLSCRGKKTLQEAVEGDAEKQREENLGDVVASEEEDADGSKGRDGRCRKRHGR